MQPSQLCGSLSVVHLSARFLIIARWYNSEGQKVQNLFTPALTEITLLELLKSFFCTAQIQLLACFYHFRSRNREAWRHSGSSFTSSGFDIIYIAGSAFSFNFRQFYCFCTILLSSNIFAAYMYRGHLSMCEYFIVFFFKLLKKHKLKNSHVQKRQLYAYPGNKSTLLRN